MENNTANVFTGDEIIKVREKIAVSALQILAVGMKIRNVKLRDVKTVLNLTSRTASECLAEYRAKNPYEKRVN